MLAVLVLAGSFSGGKPPGGMFCLFPFAKPLSISNAFSVFPLMSNHRGDSFRNGAEPAQYKNVDTTMNVERSLHSVMTAATPDMKQMPCRRESRRDTTNHVWETLSQFSGRKKKSTRRSKWENKDRQCQLLTAAQ